MKARKILGILLIAAGVSAATKLASAQESSLPPQATASEKPESKAGPQKARKVWTNDDIDSVRSPADTYTAEKEAHASRTTPAAKPSSSNDKLAPAPPPPGGPPALTNPKTADQADSMIAWENRDIEAQQGTIARMQKELDEAPPERREAMQKSLQQRMQVLAETRKELEALQGKKQELQNPPPTGSNAPADKPSSQ